MSIIILDLNKYDPCKNKGHIAPNLFNYLD